VGFFLGVVHRSQWQQFYSGALAKQVVELLFEAFGKHLTKEAMAQMSGAAILELSDGGVARCRETAAP
jgi:hypothetical protein